MYYTAIVTLFMLKKWFFDYWDHFLHFLLINVLFLISLIIPLVLPSSILPFSNVLSIVVLILGLLWLGIFSSACSLYINEIAQYRSPELKQFFSYLRKGLAFGLLHSGLWAIMILLLYIVIPFYSAMQNLLGVAAMAFIFWSLIFFVLSMQYYFPIIAQLDKRPGKVLRKMFIIFFDNPLFSVFLLIISVFVFLISGLTAFLFFGPGGIMLLAHVALKLRLYKYDYLEENPGVSRRKIPWQALIHEDRERVGIRTLKGIIFPWKD